MIKIILWGIVLILVSLLGCTPSATSNSQRANQDSAQDTRQQATQGHAESTNSVPINLQCIQIFTGKGKVTASPCFLREGGTLTDPSGSIK